FVVIRNAALGPAVVGIAFEPGVETGFFSRLREMRRTPLQFSDLFADAIEITTFIEEAGAQLNHAFGGAGDAFAEPQGARVIFFRVIDGLEGAGANALHIPEMKEFVRCDAGHGAETLLDGFGV